MYLKHVHHTLFITAGTNASTFPTFQMPTFGDSSMNYVTPIAPILPTITPTTLPSLITTDPNEFYRHLSPIKTFPKFLKPPPPTLNNIPKYASESQHKPEGDNITVYTLNDPGSPYKIIQPDPSLTSINDWQTRIHKPSNSIILEPLKIPLNVDHILRPPISPMHAVNPPSHIAGHPISNYKSFVPSDSKMHDLFQNSKIYPENEIKPMASLNAKMKQNYEPVRKVPISKLEHFNYFLPVYDRKSPNSFKTKESVITPPPITTVTFFEPVRNRSALPLPPQENPNLNSYHTAREHSLHGSRGKHVTILRTKDLVKNTRPNDDNALWTQDTKTHVLTKAPNPYETVLLRPVPNVRTELSSKAINIAKNPRIAEKTYSALDLEHLLSQMEVESEVNRNLGRSADKNLDASVQGQLQTVCKFVFVPCSFYLR